MQAVTTAGVVLLDLFDPASDQQPVFAWAMGRVLDRYPAVDDEGLLTMGAYLCLLDRWTSPQPAAPTLLVAADPRRGRSARWPLWPAGGTVAVAGADHFSLVEEHAGRTAEVVDSWLGTVPAADVKEDS